MGLLRHRRIGRLRRIHHRRLSWHRRIRWPAGLRSRIRRSLRRLSRWLKPLVRGGLRRLIRRSLGWLHWLRGWLHWLRGWLLRLESRLLRRLARPTVFDLEGIGRNGLVTIVGKSFAG